MIDIGHFALISALLLSAYATVVGAWGAAKQRDAATRSARNALAMVAICGAISLVALCWSFVQHDYRYAYVWRTSNNEMPTLYLISAVWGGMDGSMLLWAVLLSLYATLSTYLSPQIPRSLMRWMIPVLSSATAFFYGVVALLTNPFRFVPIEVAQSDGMGLNPVLQNPSMMIHPPTLYLGFTGFVVPYALASAVLLDGGKHRGWTDYVRTWTFVAWLFLTVGIVLGGNWAYIELGWGGFWAWDPVENASFLPWLVATALIHSVMVEERRGMLRIWNISLAILTYLLSVFGTFLTRSGVVQSVHAFASSDVGEVFLLYLGVIVVISAIGIFRRRVVLSPENRLESYFSREAVFLFNNLLLLGICFATFWGVMFPVFSEALTGRKSVVGPPFFDKVNGPLFLCLLFFMAVGPLVAWRRTSLSALRRLFFGPLVFSGLLTLLGVVLDPERPKAGIAFGLAFFILITVLAELHRGAKVRRALTGEGLATAALAVVRSKPRKYGGLLVHLGVAVCAVSIAAATIYKIERDLVVKKGERVEIGGYALTIDEMWESAQPNYTVLHAGVRVEDRLTGRLLTRLTPERRFYLRNEEITSEVDIRMTLKEDLYVALAGMDVDPNNQAPVDLQSTPAILKVFINPLQVWLWIGSVVMLLGSFLSLSSVLKRVRVEAPAPAPSELLEPIK